GIARSLFVPLSLAVGFAMLASFVLSNTLVPALATGLLAQKKHGSDDGSFVHKLRDRHARLLDRVSPLRSAIVVVYLVVTVAGVVFLARRIPTDLFPLVDTGQFQ